MKRGEARGRRKCLRKGGTLAGEGKRKSVFFHHVLKLDPPGEGEHRLLAELGEQQQLMREQV